MRQMLYSEQYLSELFEEFSPKKQTRWVGSEKTTCSIKAVFNNAVGRDGENVHEGYPNQLPSWFRESSEIPSDGVHVNSSMAGAVVTAWAWKRDTEENYAHVWNRFGCQLRSHALFAQKHRYDYIFWVRNTTNTARDERSRTLSLPSYWVKIEALLDVLERGHPWVIWVDTDLVIANNTRSVEQYFALSTYAGLLHSKDKSRNNIKESEKVFLWLPRAHFGWNTDSFLIKNTAHARAFLRHWWGLRKVCPNCVGEQCASNIALQELLATEALAKVEEGSLQDATPVYGDNGNQCCFPRSLCQYPWGYDSSSRHHYENKKHGLSAQGCLWAWEAALGFANEADDRGRVVSSRRTKFVSGELDLREFLGFNHPVKKIHRCEELTGERLEVINISSASERDVNLSEFVNLVRTSRDLLSAPEASTRRLTHMHAVSSVNLFIVFILSMIVTFWFISMRSRRATLAQAHSNLK